MNPTQACISSYLRVNATCPICRKPLNEITCTPRSEFSFLFLQILNVLSFFSNLVLKRLLDKLPVTCPNSDSCKETSQRGILEDHLKYRYKETMMRIDHHHLVTVCQFASSISSISSSSS